MFCLEMCARTLFPMLVKFGAVLSIVCGFFMIAYTWTHLLQCFVVVQLFLRMLKLRKASGPQTLSLKGGSYSVSWCVRTWIKLTPEYPFNFFVYLLN